MAHPVLPAAEIKHGDSILAGADDGYPNNRVTGIKQTAVRGAPGLEFTVQGPRGSGTVYFQLGEGVRYVRQTLRELPEPVLREELARREDRSRAIGLLAKLENVVEDLQDDASATTAEVKLRITALIEAQS